MAILSSQIYDANRDVYLERERYEREREMQLRHMKEEDYLRQHSMYAQSQSQVFQGQISQGQLGQAIYQAAPDPKDPLAFLNKAHTKLLLTGEAS